LIRPTRLLIYTVRLLTVMEFLDFYDV